MVVFIRAWQEVSFPSGILIVWCSSGERGSRKDPLLKVHWLGWPQAHACRRRGKWSVLHTLTASRF